MWQLSDLAGGQRPDYGLTRHIENGDRHMCVECDYWRIQTTDPRGSGGERGREYERRERVIYTRVLRAVRAVLWHGLRSVTQSRTGISYKLAEWTRPTDGDGARRSAGGAAAVSN